MGGGLMQLVAYGAQDVYLTGSPQITFFKVVYRRHTNFAVEPIPQTFNGAADFGRTVTCTINRNGDLITNMYVNINLQAQTGLVPGVQDFGYVRRLGLAIVQHYKIEIGGSKLDEQYGDWLNIWYELSHKVGQERGFSRMVGDVPELTDINSTDKPQYQLYVPLSFWFNRNNGLALPLIALQYHDVRITIDFRTAAACVNKLTNGSAPAVAMNDAQLIIDYVYLDSEERKRFAQASHEYLFEQLQFTGSESLPSLSNKYRLNFNHPSKYLVWAPKLEKYAAATDYLAYAADSNWDAALERYAKVMWLATRNGLSGSTGDYRIVNTISGNLGEVVQPDYDDSWVDSSIDNFVQAQIVFSNDISGSSPSFSAALDNVVILSNKFTIKDLSLSAGDSLAAFVSTSGTGYPAAVAVAFAGDHSFSIVDHFNYGNFINRSDNPVVSAKLQLNGSDRFQERDGYYFNYVQPWQHFSNTPADGINVYSFALKPEDHQPSGTCNFSRIDNATLQVRLGLRNTDGDSAYLANYLGGSNSNSSLNIYTVNYNVLRVMSGMAGAAYSN
uniref:Major capsid protein n=1 Tax=viral metagenome TaxID=1070528 RepID=A0A6C0DA96_9ZZZZ